MAPMNALPRRTLHAAFGLLVLTAALLLAWHAWQWQGARAGNARLARAAAAAMPPSGAEERLAWATAVAGQGHFDEAVKVLKTLAQPDAPAAVRPIALYNLGTLYLEQARRRAGPQGEALPLIELGKQPLRELLRLQPEDWAARYQLERALRLAPEVDEPARDEAAPDVPKERTMSTGPAIRIELP